MILQMKQPVQGRLANDAVVKICKSQSQLMISSLPPLSRPLLGKTSSRCFGH